MFGSQIDCQYDFYKNVYFYNSKQYITFSLPIKLVGASSYPSPSLKAFQVIKLRLQRFEVNVPSLTLTTPFFILNPCPFHSLYQVFLKVTCRQVSTKIQENITLYLIFKIQLYLRFRAKQEMTEVFGIRVGIQNNRKKVRHSIGAQNLFNIPHTTNLFKEPIPYTI